MRGAWSASPVPRSQSSRTARRVGTDLTRVAAAALRHAPIEFVGTARRDLLTGEIDVIVTDGFTGNVALKTMEGTAKVVGEYLKRALRSTAVSTLGGLLSKAALDGMKKRLDWREAAARHSSA